MKKEERVGGRNGDGGGREGERVIEGVAYVVTVLFCIVIIL